MTTLERPTAAFVLSLVAGVLILASTLFGLFSWMAWGGMGNWWNGWGGMMCPMCRWWSGGGWMMPTAWSTFSLIGVVSGIIILTSALMLQSRPTQSQTWGILILVFSIVSIFGMGGFLIGAVLGILGGILALTWKPT